MHEDIEIVIHIVNGGPMEVKLLIEAFNAVEMALYDSDRQDIEAAARELALPALVKDACLERLRHHRNKRFLLTGAAPGSMLLFGMVAGVALSVLKSTLGESFREGFKESDVGQRIKEFFRRSFSRKPPQIAEGLRRAGGALKSEVSVSVISVSEHQAVRIEFTIDRSQRRLAQPAAKTLGEELASGDRP